MKADLYVKLAGGQQVVGGYSLQVYQNGNMGTGTKTFDPLNGNYQTAINNGAITISAPIVDCAMDILIVNATGAGTVSFSGFTTNANTGEPLTTTVNSMFILSIRRLGGVSTYIVKALQ